MPIALSWFLISQTHGQSTPNKQRLPDSLIHIIANEDGEAVSLSYFFAHAKLSTNGLQLSDGPVCKSFRVVTGSSYTLPKATKEKEITKPEPAIQSTKVPFLTIHGNIMYDVSYRSAIDTPYAERDVYQHTVQTYMDITVKDKYPVRFYFTNRFSNSAFSRDFSNLNFQFNQQQFNQKIREQLKARLQQQLVSQKELDSLSNDLTKKTREFTGLQQWLKNPATLQKLVEAREAALLKQRGDIPQKPKLPDTELSSSLDQLTGLKDLLPNYKFSSTEKQTGRAESLAGRLTKKYEALQDKADSLKAKVSSFTELYEQKKNSVDSIRKELASLEQKVRAARQQKVSTENNALKSIDHISNTQQLQDKLKELHLSDTILPKGYKTLFAVKSFGIGRNTLDYSELTAKNISVTGIQVEYNPSYYVAVASGYVDYRFRDITVQNAGPKQYLNVIRFGQGMKEGNHVYFSYYFGSRQLYNSATATPGTIIPNYNLVGYSVEGQYKLNNTTFLVAELAKSSRPYYNRANVKGSLLSDAVQFNERSNEAWSLQLNSYLPQTGTKLSGSFKRTGNNFQSFSVFTTGSSQTGWMAKVEQPFLKRRLNIAASMRTNDFVNPYIGNNYKSSMVFKSIQASVRIKKWPTVTAGYYPSSQLVKLSETQYTENLFYTLMGSLNHSYRYGQTMMNSSLVYSRFYNSPADTGFVYFNTTNLLFSQNVFLKKFSFLLNLTASSNTSYALYTAENNVQYRAKEWLTVGAGIKYNQQTVYNTVLLGYSANATIKIPKLGEVQFMADKGYMPGSNKQLVPNNAGRVTYFRAF